MLGTLLDGRRPFEDVGRADRRAVRLLAVTIWVTVGLPSVIVPVLSSSTVARWPTVPALAAPDEDAVFGRSPVPRESPSAWRGRGRRAGVISTDTNATSQTRARAPAAAVPRRPDDERGDRDAMTIGTTPRDAVGESLNGALVACASRRAARLPQGVSLPTRVARNVMLPVVSASHRSLRHRALRDRHGLAVSTLRSRRGAFVTTPSTGTFSPA